MNNFFYSIINAQRVNYYKFTIVRNTWARIFSFYKMMIRNPEQYNNFNLSFDQFLYTKMKYENFSQLNYLINYNGKIELDFIGRFENLQNDFNKVCETLQIKDPILPKLLVKKYSHYTDNYTPQTKDLIYRLYKDEIDYFGFEYGE